MRKNFLLALLALTALASAMLSGPTGFGPGAQSANAATFNEIRKLLASDAAIGDTFGVSVAVSGDTAVVGGLL